MDDAYDGVAIVKPEDDATMGRTLKICSFKVADRANGWKFGELLLKAIFDFCVVNKFAAVYVTVFERHARLIQLFGLFGFLAQEGRTGRGELVLAKRLIPPADRATFAPLDFHTRFGPPEVRAVANDPGYVIPIKPVYHDALFPDAIPEQRQQSLALEPSKPFGNAIRKAYLCHAIIRKIAPGDNAFFYRSFDARAIACTGVIESTLVSQSVEEIARLVGTRTVYRFEEIQEMCAEGKVLVLMFRHARTLRGAISFEELAQNGVLKGPPQSIVQVHDDSARAWLANRITEQP